MSRSLTAMFRPPSGRQAPTASDPVPRRGIQQVPGWSALVVLAYLRD